MMNFVIDAILKIMKENKISVKIIMSKDHLENDGNKLQLLLSHEIISSLYEIIGDSNADEIVRKGNVPFNLCSIDGKRCFLELPKLGNQDFTMAFCVVDNDINQRTKNIFQTIWNAADAVSTAELKKIIKK